jgi:hypothetical protein
MCESECDPQLLERVDDPLTYLKTRKIASLEMAEKERKKEESINSSVLTNAG